MTGLEELVNLPNIYLGTSFITDIAATYIAVKKKGTRVEVHKKFKDLMKKHGPHSLFTRILPLQAVIGGVPLGIGYAVDRFVGIDDLPINLHKGLAYLIGTYKHTQAIGQIAGIYDNRYAQHINHAVRDINGAIARYYNLLRNASQK